MHDLTLFRRLLAEASRRMGFPNDSAVVLEGSIAEGFGNEKSDVDFVLVDGAQGNVHLMPTLLFIEGRRVEVRRYTVAELHRQANAIVSKAAAGRKSLESLDEEMLDRWQRFSRSIVMQNPELVERVRGFLPLPAFETIVSRWLACKAERTGRLAQALAAIHDEKAAVSWARSALTDAAKHWLAREHHETYLAKKWISQQLGRVAESPLCAEFYELETPRRAMLDDRAYVGACVSLMGRFGVTLSPVDLAAISINSNPGITTWQIGSRVHIVRNKREVFALGELASKIWRTICFGRPLSEVLSSGIAPVTKVGVLLSQFHRLGFFELSDKRYSVKSVRSKSTLAPALTMPLLSIDGAVQPSGEEFPDIWHLPISADQFAAAGMQLIYVNMVVENAHEDALGALTAAQWGVLERSIRRMIRFSCKAALVSCGMHPLPAVEEIHLALDDVPAFPRVLAEQIRSFEDGVAIDDHSSAQDALSNVDRVCRQIREWTGSSLFPSCFTSPQQWQRTLDVGYDWVRLGAFLDADFPIEQTRELIASGGRQPMRLRTDEQLAPTGS